MNLPFRYCYDVEITDDLTRDIQVMLIEQTELRTLADLHTHDEPDAAPQATQDGGTGVTSCITWSELLYEMTDGALGTKPSDTPQLRPRPR